MELTATEKRTTYMREYKREQYKLGSEKILQTNKMSYYKKKYGCSSDDAKLYGDCLIEACNLKLAMVALRNKNESLYSQIISSI